MDSLLHLLSSNQLFTTTLTIVLFIGLLELVLTLMGIGISSFLDNTLDLAFDGPSIDGGPDIDMPTLNSDISTFSEIFSWLNKGKVPLLILIIVFLTLFGLTGLLLQNIYASFTGSYMYTLIAAPIAFVISMPLVRYISSFVSKIMPKDDTTVISSKTYVGHIATIVLGTATYTKEAQAKFIDVFNETHYMQVKSHIEGELFSQGDSVFIIQNDPSNESLFYVITDPNVKGA